MQHKLSDIINTDCYIQFDTNEQLREFVKANGMDVQAGIFGGELFISVFSEFDFVMTVPEVTIDLPIYHHTNIEK